MDIKIEHTKRDNILSTAQRLFTRFGLRKTTVEEIIRLTKIAKGTFYKYFPDKEVLFLEVVEKESASLVTAIREAVSQHSNSQEKMKAYLKTKAHTIADLVNFCQVTKDGIDEYWPRIDKIREKYLSEELKIVREILTDGINNGELEVANPELTAYAIVIAVKGFESKWMMENSPVEMEESVDILLHILFQGILKR